MDCRVREVDLVPGYVLHGVVVDYRARGMGREMSVAAYVDSFEQMDAQGHVEVGPRSSNGVVWVDCSYCMYYFAHGRRRSSYYDVAKVDIHWGIDPYVRSGEESGAEIAPFDAFELGHSFGAMRRCSCVASDYRSDD